MEMTHVRVSCVDQKLTVVQQPLLSSGTVNGDLISFTFCELWEGFTKTAVFCRDPYDPDTSYHVLLENDECVIPKEVLRDEGVMIFGIMGVKGDTVRTSQMLQYHVALGAVSEGTQIPDPTPDIYAQILARIQEVESGAVDPAVVEDVVEQYLKDHPPGPGFTTDKTLTLNPNTKVLSVNTADSPEQDNTLPITAAAVHTTVGNIEILLATI